ncbi:MAG: FAD-dependent oxidoreductase [Bacteroidota bacterium]|nr:FAD-dependent oxidoreductase [Bacteroidota bacterium]
MRLLFIFLSVLSISGLGAQKIRSVDICIYGSTSGGVIAAYTAAKMGKKVLLVTPDNHPGGITSGGLGMTDIGNKSAITGIARDFYRRIGEHYGKREQWIFEPHVAEAVFNTYLRLGKVEVWYGQGLLSVVRNKQKIQEIETGSTQKTDADRRTVRAAVFIDCSYEGDLMAKAGVSYTIGREPNSLYHETYNGVQLRDKHQFPDAVDPYRIPGDSQTGLLWGISAEQLAPDGTGDKKIQAYNFRVCLTDSVANRIDITRPAGYDSSRYLLLLRYLEKKNPASLDDGVLNINLMPGRKTDINNNGPFSTDMIGMNYDYPEAGPGTRKEIILRHEIYVKGLLYFLGHDERVPTHLRNEMLRWGYPKDEYQDNDHWSPQLYIREARRMTGEYIMTQANCTGMEKVADGIGMAAYTMDAHNCERVIVNGMVKNEGDVQIGGFPPYPVSYRAIVPKTNECSNLLVPVCLSASHIAYGSIRMEPVFMVLGQSAALAAVLALNLHLTVQQVKIEDIRRMLRQM